MLVVLAALLVPLSVVTAWTVNTITNTTHYVETLAPVARQKVVTDYLAVEATNKIFDSIDVQGQISAALPKKARFIAAPVTAELHSFVEQQMTKLFASQWFGRLWDSTNRRSHAALVDLLTGRPIPGVQAARGIVVNLTPALDRAIDQLDAHGVTVFNPIKGKLAKGNELSLSVVSGSQVGKLQTLFRYATDLGWLLPLVTVLVLAAAVAVAVDRRKALLRAAVGSAITVVIFLGALAVGRAFFIDHAGKVPPSVTGTLFDTVIRFLHNGLWDVLYLCLAVAVVLWLIGPARWAVWLRTVGRSIVPSRPQ